MDTIKKVLNSKEKNEITLLDLYYDTMIRLNKAFETDGLDVAFNTDLTVFNSLMYNKHYIKDYFTLLRSYNDSYPEDSESNYMFIVLPVSITKMQCKDAVDKISRIVRNSTDVIDSFTFRPLYRVHDNYYGEDGNRSNQFMSDLLEDNNITEFIVSTGLFSSNQIPSYILNDRTRSFVDTYYKGISYCTFVIDKKKYTDICNELQHCINSYDIYTDKEGKARDIIELTLNDNPNYHKLKHQRNKISGRLQDMINDYNKICKAYDSLIQSNVHKNINQSIVTLFETAAYNLENILRGNSNLSNKPLDQEVLNSFMEELNSTPEAEPLSFDSRSIGQQIRESITYSTRNTGSVTINPYYTGGYTNSIDTNINIQQIPSTIQPNEAEPMPSFLNEPQNDGPWEEDDNNDMF